MADTFRSLNSDIPLVKAREMSINEDDDLGVFHGMMVAGAASMLLWIVLGMLAYAAYRLF